MHGYNNRNNITIASSNFTDNELDSGGGCYIQINSSSYNYITIVGSRFIKNKVGNGGGLFIKLNISYNNITIEGSELSDNDISATGGACYILSYDISYNNITIVRSELTNNKVGNIGGGCYILSDNNQSNNTITITSSKFNGNQVGHGGGCCIWFNINSYNYITIADSIFTNNIIINEGGGMYMLIRIGAHSIVTMTNSTFTNNAVGDEGGGLVLSSGQYSRIQINMANCNFSCNYAYVYPDKGDFNEYVYGVDIINFGYTTVDISNSTITRNDGFGGLGLYTADGQIKLSQVKLSNNSGHGIYTNGYCKIIFTEGHSVIANNSSPTDGGGIYLDIGSSLTTTNGGHVSFINNTAKRYGGAIYALDNDKKIMTKPLEYHYDDNACSVYNLSATFINNSAVRAGDVLYNGLFIICPPVLSTDINKANFTNYLLQCLGVPATITNSTSIHPLSTVSSEPIIICPCVNNIVNCTSTLDRDVYRYPGQILQVSLATVGLCGGISPGAIVVTSEAKEINLFSGSTTDYTSTTCRTLNYTIKLNTYISNTILTIDVADGILYNNIGSMKVNLTILDCPLGLVLDFTSGDCVCSNEIIHLSGIHCNILWMPYPIARSGKNWISHKNGKYNCTIAHTGCPFDYCNTSTIKLSLRESDLQCNYNRSGILCGQCKQGLSLMIGSNRCANCTDTTLVTISIFIIATVAGIVLVIFLIALNLTVAVGSINGLLFYTNIVKLNESMFFSQGNIPVISQFISWCNLDLGIEYCFIDGLDGYIKTWLQFAFPVYVWVLVVIFIVAC